MTKYAVSNIVMNTWPEYKALMERLGIATDRPTRRLRLDFEMDCEVIVHHEYIGTEEGPK